MALNSLYCADVPLSNYSLAHSLNSSHSTSETHHTVTLSHGQLVTVKSISVKIRSNTALNTRFQTAINLSIVLSWNFVFRSSLGL